MDTAKDVRLDVLAFAPHPDDAELGCGGALRLSVEQGLQVGVADLSGGEKASRGNPTLRQEEIKRATAILKLNLRVNLGLPDTRLGQNSRHRLVVIEAIRRFRPRIVLAPYWHDRHPDHAAAGRLVRSAAFYAGVASVGEGKPHRPEQVFYYMLHQPFQPAFVLDISKVWEAKAAAIQAYNSQFAAGEAGNGTENNDVRSEGGEPPEAGKSDLEMITALAQPSFWRFVEARAIYYGGMVGAAYGEPYYSAGPLGLNQFPGLDNPPPQPGQLPVYKPFI